MSERRYRHPQVNLRLPEELKERVAVLAEKNKRSANAEMVAAIESWVERWEGASSSGELVSWDEAFLPQSAEDTLIMSKNQLQKIIATTMEEAMEEFAKGMIRDYRMVKRHTTPDDGDN
ncbi:Arc family DNA-binding protein [Salmonella enterica]|nr:Arc family DNA-binding protein [Salmonella enterica]